MTKHTMTKKGYLLGGVAAALMTLFATGCFCGAGPDQAEASLYVSDTATGAPVRAPAFRDQGRSISPRCMELDSQDQSLCTSQVLVLSRGVHQIEVSAEGYAAITVEVDTMNSNSAHLAVEMHRE